MLEKRKILDQIEIKSNGVIFIKELNQIIDNGNIISSIPHRSSVCPLDDVSNHEHQMVRDAASAHWTQSVKDAYAAFLAEQENGVLGNG